MRREKLSLRLSPEGAARLVADLAKELESHPPTEDEISSRTLQVTSGGAQIDVTLREATDLMYAVETLVAEELSGTESHDHVYDDDYERLIDVWIEPDGSNAVVTTL